MNDLPVPKTSADLTQVPMLDPAKPTRATTAQEYARLFFRDVDGTEMGMAIYQASGGSLGWWEYSLDGGATYIKVRGTGRTERERGSGKKKGSGMKQRNRKWGGTREKEMG